jgi:hypothetical protein
VNFIATYQVSISLITTDDSASTSSKCIDSCSEKENATLNKVVHASRHLKKSKTVIDHCDNKCTNNCMRDATATTEEANAAHNCGSYT